MSNGASLIKELDGFIEQVTSTKAAEASSEQGHVQNQGDTGTSHPSKSTDDGTQKATEGSRSSENTSDVKSDVPGQSVDEAAEDKMEGKSENPLTTAKPTGEDPANETQSASGLIGGDAGKDSEGKDTSHPAKVDFGGKYASVAELLSKNLKKEAAVTLSARLNDFNAAIAALDLTEKPAADPKSSPAKSEVKKAEDEAEGENAGKKETPSHEAGESAAEEAAEEGAEREEKMSADERAGREAAKVAAASLGLSSGPTDQANLIAGMAKRAIDDANSYVDFLVGMQDGAVQAEKEAHDRRIAEARRGATLLRNHTKQAMENDMAGADAIAYGGEGEAPDEAGAGAGAGGNEIEQIIAELEANGIDPEMLTQLDPADLAEAIANAGSGEAGPPPGEGEVPPQDQAAEMVPAAAM